MPGLTSTHLPSQSLARSKPPCTRTNFNLISKIVNGEVNNFFYKNRRSLKILETSNGKLQAKIDELCLELKSKDSRITALTNDINVLNSELQLLSSKLIQSESSLAESVSRLNQSHQVILNNELTIRNNYDEIARLNKKLSEIVSSSSRDLQTKALTASHVRLKWIKCKFRKKFMEKLIQVSFRDWKVIKNSSILKPSCSDNNLNPVSKKVHFVLADPQVTRSPLVRPRVSHQPPSISPAQPSVSPVASLGSCLSSPVLSPSGAAQDDPDPVHLQPSTPKDPEIQLPLTAPNPSPISLANLPHSPTSASLDTNAAILEKFIRDKKLEEEDDDNTSQSSDGVPDDSLVSTFDNDLNDWLEFATGNNFGIDVRNDTLNLLEFFNRLKASPINKRDWINSKRGDLKLLLLLFSKLVKKSGSSTSLRALEKIDLIVFSLSSLQLVSL